MVNPQDVEAVIRRLAEARDQALREAPLHLHFKCQRCSEIEPISEAVGVEVEVEVEFPPDRGQRPRPEIRCKGCFTEMLLSRDQS